MYYDLVMLAIVAYTTIRGAAKGMAWQLAAIAALVLCFGFAAPASVAVAPAIPFDAPLNRWVAMLAIYLAFSFVCFGLARMWRGWLEALKFEEYDRHLGALFGMLKGAVICLVITFFTVCIAPSARNSVLSSRSGSIAGTVLDQLAVVMPAELGRALAPYLKRYDEAELAARGEQPGNPDDDTSAFRGSSRQPARGETDLFSSPGERAAAGTDDDSGDPLDAVVERAAGAIEDRLKSGVKQIVRDALSRDDDVVEPVPAGSRDTNAPLAKNAAAGQSLQAALAEVVRLLASSPEEQQAQYENIDALLRGIPDSVSAAALADWHADLSGVGHDPDPRTDLITSLDARLRRQLRSARIGIENLPRPVRQRLDAASDE